MFLQGHIQLAERETPLIPCSIGAQTKLVNDSAIERREPLAESTRADTGACPIEVAIPFSPWKSKATAPKLFKGN